MLSFFTIFTSVVITWFNVVIDIPIGKSLNDYKSIPYATLSIDGKNKQDSRIYYEYEVGTTTFSVINTNYVGEYTVDYEVHFPTHGFSSIQKITFNVYDNIAPTIIGEKEMVFEVNDKLPNFKDVIDYYDNYDHKKDLTLIIDDSRVNNKVLGSYNVYYDVIDKSQNKTRFTQIIKILDRTAPTVSQKEEIILKINESINLDKYFKIDDNYDKVLIKELDDTKVNYRVPGIYPVVLKVFDQSNNQTTVNTTITIEDNESPKIILKTNSITVDYQEQLLESTLRDLILAVNDNVDTFNVNEVIINNYVDTNYLGNYEVIYEITDSSNLKGLASLVVKVVDLTPPIVELKEEINVLIYELEPYLLDYLKITDNYDNYNDLTITTSGKVDMNKVGENRIIVTAKDSSKNETVLPVIVNVIDNIPPTIIIPNSITINNFLRPDYDSLIKVTDNYDKDCQVIVLDSSINYQIIGNHTIDIKAFDSSLNETTVSIDIEIVDTTIPEISLTTNLIYVELKEEIIDFKKYIDNVFDDYDKDLTVDDVLIISNINYEKIGTYEVNFYLKDKSNNSVEEVLLVKIIDNILPTLEIHPAIINVNDYFNYFEYVKAYDNYDGDITNLVKINPSFIPTNSIGVYEIIYYVYDSSGNYIEEKGLLTIKDNDKYNDYVIYFSGLIVLIIGIIIFYKIKTK